MNRLGVRARITRVICAAGNTFYLVMPTEGESATDDLNDPPTPTASHFPQPPEEVMSPQVQPEEETPADQEEETGELQTGHQSHIIRNVDEIFLTIESLMSKLRRLKVSCVAVVTWTVRVDVMYLVYAVTAVFLPFLAAGNRTGPSRASQNHPRAVCQSRVRGRNVSLGNGLQDAVSGSQLGRR